MWKLGVTQCETPHSAVMNLCREPSFPPVIIQEENPILSENCKSHSNRPAARVQQRLF